MTEKELQALRLNIYKSIDANKDLFESELSEGRDMGAEDYGEARWALNDMTKHAVKYHHILKSGGDSMEGMLHLYEIVDRLIVYLKETRLGNRMKKSHSLAKLALQSFIADPHSMYDDLDDHDHEEDDYVDVHSHRKGHLY